MDGWEAAEVTDYVYDEAGRLIRSVTTREAEWDDTEQGWMLALAEWERGRCHLCGGDLTECWDRSSEGRWQVPPPIRCQRTTAIAAGRKPYENNDTVPAPHALMFWAQLREAR